MTSREQSVEFTCERIRCPSPGNTWTVEGRFNADGEFEPTTIDEMGSDMDCPECGEPGDPTNDDVRVADL